MESKKFTRVEREIAEERLANEVIDNYYWWVDGDQDNLQDLQNILDVVFNSIEGNQYIVKYGDFQSGTRLTVECQICSKELLSHDTIVAHENGKHHKKIQQKSLTNVNPNIDEDLQIVPLNKPRRTFPDGSLEQEIDASNSTILGMQFVYKEEIDGDDTYTCQLCQKYSSVFRISSSRMFLHLTSSHHNKNYLEVKFGYFKKSSRDFNEECRSIEEYEGRIHSKIVDFTPGNVIKKPKIDESTSLPSTSEIKQSDVKIETPEIPESDESTIETSAVPKTVPQTCDVGVMADITSETHYPLHLTNSLLEPDCLMTLHDDEDMQTLLQETLWVLADKMEKYYNETGDVIVEDKTKIPLTACAQKVKKYITEYERLKEKFQDMEST